MARPRRWNVSLAPKLSLFFGAAALLTIAVTLLFPSLQMTALNHQALLERAKQVAIAVRQSVDLAVDDWAVARRELARTWPQIVRTCDLPPHSPPVLVSADDPHLPGARLRQRDSFQQQALAHFTLFPQATYYWALRENQYLRLALAVRDDATGWHPGRLRGLIDVELRVTQSLGVWNVVVTFLAGASGAVLAMLAFYVVTQRLVLTRVQALQRVAEQVTSGDLDVRSQIESGDEFEELGSVVNAMLTHLRAAQDDLRKINRSLDVRLGELAEINVGLYESNRLKSDFLANVSHELRTPLASIIGFAELLRDAWDNPNLDRQRLARYANNILASGRSLLDIINDLLDLAKIEAGRLELHLSEFSLLELARDLGDFVQPLVDKRSHTLVLELPETLPACHSDAGRIKQVLYNLLSNAIKFTPTGGRITLHLEPRGLDQVVVSVQDTGPGIDPDKQELIFEKFRQLDSSRTREYEGAGLGLAITGELVAMLGGRISVQSEPGEGATFTVELPMRIEAPAWPGGVRAGGHPRNAGDTV